MPKQTLFPGYVLQDNVSVLLPLLRHNMFKNVQQAERYMHHDVYESMSYVWNRFKMEEQWWMFIDVILHRTLWSYVSAYLSFMDEFDLSTPETHYTMRATIKIRLHAVATWYASILWLSDKTQRSIEDLTDNVYEFEILASFKKIAWASEWGWFQMDEEPFEKERRRSTSEGRRRSD